MSGDSGLLSTLADCQELGPGHAANNVGERLKQQNVVLFGIKPRHYDRNLILGVKAKFFPRLFFRQRGLLHIHTGPDYSYLARRDTNLPAKHTGTVFAYGNDTVAQGREQPERDAKAPGLKVFNGMLSMYELRAEELGPNRAVEQLIEVMGMYDA